MAPQTTQNRIPTETKIRATFLAGLVIVFVIGGFSYWSIRDLLDATDASTRAHAVHVELQDVLTRVDDAETGQRGYIITGEDRYLLPYKAAVTAITREIQDVYARLDGEPQQEQRLRELERIVQERLARLEEGIELRRTAGVEAATARMRSGRGLELMQQFRRGVAEIQFAADERIRERDVAVHRHTARTIAVIGVGGLLALLIIGAANLVIQHELAARLQAETTNRKLAAIVDSSSDAIIGTTLEGVITSWNAGAEKLFGYAAGEVLGRPRSLLVPAERADEVPTTIEVLRRGETVPHFETERVRRDGTRVDVSMTLSPIHDAGGAIIGASAIARDISDRKELERQRADFLAMITHDIKNPLAVIYSYIDILESGQRLAPQDEELVKSMGSSAETILDLVNDYLDLSKIEAGRMTLTRRPTPLNEVLDRVANQLDPAIRRRGIVLECQLDPDLPDVEGDPVALERIFSNLAHNAIKFLPDGGTLTLRSARQDSTVVVDVADNGPGIAADELPLLFERYRQTATGRAKKGTGMGLFIVKYLTEAHGGQVRVESEPGRGTCFRVQLPIRSA